MPAERAQLLANLAVEIVFADALATRRALTDEALAIARGESATTRRSRTCSSRAASRCWDLSTLDERLDHGEELAGLTAAIGDPHLEYFAGWYRYAALVEAGRHRARPTPCSRCAASSRARSGRRMPVWVHTFTRAGRALLAGDTETAEALAAEQLEIGRARSGSPTPRSSTA